MKRSIVPRPRISLFLFVCLTFSMAWGADLSGSRIITTFAGAARTFSGDGGSALMAALSGFQQVQTDRNGNVIFADVENQVVSRLNTNGTLTVLAGNGIDGFSGEGGLARSASVSFPAMWSWTGRATSIFMIP